MHARNETPCLDMTLCLKIVLDSSRGSSKKGFLLKGSDCV